MRYFELCDKSVAFAKEIMETEEFQKLIYYKNEIATTLVNALHCELIQIIGGVIVLFRKNLKDGKIHIPNI